MLKKNMSCFHCIFKYLEMVIKNLMVILNVNNYQVIQLHLNDHESFNFLPKKYVCMHVPNNGKITLNESI